MDLRGVTRAVNDSTEIYGIYLGNVFIWPDPWMDTWDEGVTVYWENEWHDAWTTQTKETLP